MRRRKVPEGICVRCLKPGDFYPSDSHWCKTCRREYRKLWAKNNPDRQAAIDLRSEQNPNTKARKAARKRELRQTDPKFRERANESLRRSRAKRLYGVSISEIEQMFYKQGNVCAICLKHRPLSVDHDHVTGKIRAGLCRDCNLGLGFFKDSLDCLKAALDYLKSAKQESPFLRHRELPVQKSPPAP